MLSVERPSSTTILPKYGWQGVASMSHSEQRGFFCAVVDANKSLVVGAKVLEIGAYDVNGSVRDLFRSASSYVGVDLQEGPGVDLVGFGHEIDHPDGWYDITISSESFEHDPHWRQTSRIWCA
jgi:hypothetical protein